MNKYGIDTKAHYFLLMRPLEGLGYRTTLSREKWVECVITESRYKIDDGFKIELMALDERYGKERFYIEDFLSYLTSGHIIKNDQDYECKEVTWEEPLTNTVNVRHSAYTLVPRKQNKKRS